MRQNYRTERRNRYNYSWRLQSPLPVLDGSSRQKISKDIDNLNNTINQFNLTLYPTPEHIFISSVHETVSRTDHRIGHISSLNKSKKIEIISGILSDHKTM